ncbi:hypothetical protein P4H27_24770 [Paenibacillus taichungensis]|uniref:Uncharacterized protein n=1 Tax=Paenibacillus taichungensis TaxID=484184 RepID=A0ABX2MIM5_9BACL|nr:MULTISPECIES: hypothetical protein [Paenibacillus]OME76760.1 hypothetical protein BK122_28325 [Paenibacillus pabuli]MDR9749241.1 hypothetical protein [Paenibacillus taichungensis]MEC0110185.1 hypothetical protein [Paenibacillus taichungensis]MEC0195448.1 hypothetical protein [Paenibacillus taichungensis]NUU53162.1 hypothetical protein [Paenibacillus taichungensis]
MAYAFMIEPQYYTALENEDELIEKCQEWGLLSEKATKVKTFYYKGNGLNMPCTIIGFVDHMAAVIQLDNDQKHCIHPSYLKEMQASSYNVKSSVGAGTAKDKSNEPVVTTNLEEIPSSDAAQDPVAAYSDKIPSGMSDFDSELDVDTDDDDTSSELKGDPDGLVEEYVGPANGATSSAAKPKAKTAGKAKSIKIDLPEGKVKMSAVVKEFTTVPNHFSDNDDEVIIYEAVTITEPEVIDVGEAWSSHSATIKKQELEVGDVLTFEAKIIKKKLTRNPVPYKINNPSKIQKEV